MSSLSRRDGPADAEPFEAPRFHGAERQIKPRWLIATVLCLGLWGFRIAGAQAREVGLRQSEIAPFAAASYIRPDYGQMANAGFTTGLDVTPLFFGHFQPAVELRVTGDTGPIAREYTYSGGLMAAIAIHSIHPYATLLKGLDTIYFNNPVVYANGPYARDSSRMFSIGVGVGSDIRSAWQVRADLSRQYWALDSPSIRPVAASLGLSYRIPFRKGKMKN